MPAASLAKIPPPMFCAVLPRNCHAAHAPVSGAQTDAQTRERNNHACGANASSCRVVLGTRA
eukprot:328978-Rhodomonas_salina.1